MRPISRPYLDVLDLPQELSEASRDARHGLCFVCLLPRSRPRACLDFEEGFAPLLPWLDLDSRRLFGMEKLIFWFLQQGGGRASDEGRRAEGLIDVSD